MSFKETVSHPSLPDLFELLVELEKCCLHDEQAAMGRLATEVVAACCDCEQDHAGPPGCHSDSTKFWLFKTADKWGVLEESEDYTGHG